jgi:spore coat protein U-like protein
MKLSACILGIWGLLPGLATAACTLSVQSANFGAYDVFDNSPVDSVGNVNVACDVTTSYTIALGPGSGTYVNRHMLSGSNELLYNLYTDAARTIVWGDGSGSTATVVSSGINNNHTIYGRIPARQNVSVGAYADTVIVTLTF